jgi:hypothetical protein
MSSGKIEAFWVNATAFEVARVIAGETVKARFRDDEHSGYTTGFLAGWTEGNPCWFCEQGGARSYFEQCQVYREPAWWANKPDPGPGWRLLEKFPDEELKPGDEGWGVWNDGEWGESHNASDGKPQSEEIWYRRRIEQLLSGHRWLVSGDRLESGDLYYEKGALLEVGHEYWGNSVMLAEAFMRKIEQPKPEPKHYVLRVGDSASLPNGQTITVTAKGFEVTQ